MPEPARQTWRLSRPLCRRSFACIIGVVTALVIVGYFGLVAYRLRAASRAVRADLQALTTDAGTPLDVARLSEVQVRIRTLNADLAELGAALRPVGVEAVAPSLPWLGRQYVAVRDTTDSAQRLGDAAERLLAVGDDITSNKDAGVGRTWVDLLYEHLPDAQRALDDLRTARQTLDTVDQTALPAEFQPLIGRLNQLLDAPEVGALAELNVPAVTAALGAERPARYLVLLQNPAELRPGGGFAGSAVLVTVDHGALADYEIFDIHQLNDDYMQRRSAPLPQPWPLATYLAQDGFPLHDAIWWPDFSRGATQLLDMYAESGWPPVDGVIAVQPSVIAQFVGLVGPFSVDLSDGSHEITSDNVYAEIESEREWFTDGHPDVVPHKQALAAIGVELLDRLRATNDISAPAVLQLLTDACQRRELQAFMPDPDAQALIDDLSCSGRLQTGPEPELSVSFANLVTDKTSQRLSSSFTLASTPTPDGRLNVWLQIHLQHTGSADEDPIYAGFQRWFVQVDLPAGSTVLSQPEAEPDPEAPNGGSYRVELWPGATAHLTIVFSMPASDVLRIRKQAGLSPPLLALAVPGCGAEQTTLVADTLVHFDQACQSGHALESTVRPSSFQAALSGSGLLKVSPQHRPRGKIDLPLANQSATGRLTVFGWAAEPTSDQGTGVDSVEVSLDGAPLGQADYGLPRPDVARLLGSDRFVDSGFRYVLDLRQVASGSHILQVALRSAQTGVVMNYRQPFQVVTGADLRGNVDLPRDGDVTHEKSLRVFGWAADTSSSQGAGIERVSVLVDGRPMGDALYGLERQDVATALASDNFIHTGYQFDLDVSDLAPGLHSVEIVAYAVNRGAASTRTVQFTIEPDGGYGR